MGPELHESAAIVRFYLDRINAETLNVHTIHAETEGMGQLETFVALMRALKDRGARFVQLRDAAARLDRAALPVCEVIRDRRCRAAPDGFPLRARAHENAESSIGGTARL